MTTHARLNNVRKSRTGQTPCDCLSEHLNDGDSKVYNRIWSVHLRWIGERPRLTITEVRRSFRRRATDAGGGSIGRHSTSSSQVCSSSSLYISPTSYAVALMLSTPIRGTCDTSINPGISRPLPRRDGAQGASGVGIGDLKRHDIARGAILRSLRLNYDLAIAPPNLGLDCVSDTSLQCSAMANDHESGVNVPNRRNELPWRNLATHRSKILLLYRQNKGHEWINNGCHTLAFRAKLQRPILPVDDADDRTRVACGMASPGL
jgi:hypothetical protein